MGWTTISNAALAVGKYFTSAQALALRDNPIALVQRDGSAPVDYGNWHPYDKVTNGDANTGLVYDFAVSGAVASVETPIFADGFEYQIRLNNLTKGSSSNLNLELYRETSATYVNATLFAGLILFHGNIILEDVRASKQYHLVQVGVAADATSQNAQARVVDVSTAQKVSKARISLSTNITGGTIHLYRRIAFPA